MTIKITPDIPYRFDCTLCGDCCRGRQSVTLNRHDLTLMARHHGVNNTSDLFSLGLTEVRQEDNGHWRPYIRFRRRPARMCPFLENEVSDAGLLSGKCKLHPFDKPLVCHLAPMGRTLDLITHQQNWQIYEPSPGCPGMGRGEPRSLLKDVSEFQARLDDEAEFFAQIERIGPECKNESEAIAHLFSWAVTPLIDPKTP